MNIIKRELKANRRSLIIWSISSFLLMYGIMAKFSVIITEDPENIRAMVDAYPKSLLAVFGLSDLDMSTLIGYYGLGYFYLLLMATIHAVMLGANIMAKEQYDKTAEFIFVKPVSINKIITSKFIAALINIIIFNLVALISSISVTLENSNKTVTNQMLTMIAGMFILQITFLCVGFFFSCITKEAKSAARNASIVVMVSYFFYILTDMSENLNFLKYITPFKFFDASYVINNNHLSIPYTIIMVIISISAMVYSYKNYNNRKVKL